MNIRMPALYVLPATEEQNDGRCIRSDLLPEDCGLTCHRASPDLPIVDDLPDIFGQAA